jgi:hypothetical protein
MRSFKFSLGILLILCLACYYSCSRKSTKGPKEETGAYNIREGYKMPYSIDLPLVPEIPGFQNRDSLIAYLQLAADTFSWKSFIALNWPANPDGTPDTTNFFGGKHKALVWEHWMPSTFIYKANNEVPNSWQTGVNAAGIPLNLGDVLELRNVPEVENFTRDEAAKMPMFKGASTQNAENYPVFDRNGNYTLYQIMYNRQAYDYVVQCKLYNKSGQREFVKSWPDHTRTPLMINGKDTLNIAQQYSRAYFPVGNYKDSIFQRDTITYNFMLDPGTVIIKTAWRLLTPQDDKSKFIWHNINVKGDTIRTLGLVGMHIIHKVAETTQWVWSTFEHVDNAPVMGADGKAMVAAGRQYSYFTGNDMDSSHYNKPPQKKDHSWDNTPIQMVELVPPTQTANGVSEYFYKEMRKLVPDNVWCNYRLVGTQWPFGTDFFTAGSMYNPAMLGNAIFETYKQSTSSCMSCHSEARFLQNKNRYSGYFADFVFGLSNAKDSVAVKK